MLHLVEHVINDKMLYIKIKKKLKIKHLCICQAVAISALIAISTGTMSTMKSPLQCAECSIPIAVATSGPVAPAMLSTQPGSGSVFVATTEHRQTIGSYYNISWLSH